MPLAFRPPSDHTNNNANTESPLTIRIPAMAPSFDVGAIGSSTRPRTRLSTRRSTGNSESMGPSGSEYHESDKSMDLQADYGHVDSPEDLSKPILRKTNRGRIVLQKNYAESVADSDDNSRGSRRVKREEIEARSADQLFNEDVEATDVPRPAARIPGDAADDEDDDDDDQAPRRGRRRRTEAEKLRIEGLTVEDLDDDMMAGNKVKTRLRSKLHAESLAHSANGPGFNARKGRQTRNSLRAAREQQEKEHGQQQRQDDDDDVYVDNPSSGGSADGDGSIDDAPQTMSDLLEIEPLEPEPEPEPLPDDDGKPYSLRQRQKINYALPTPVEEMSKPPSRPQGGRNGRGVGGGGGGGYHGHRRKGPGWSASGAELSKWIRIPGDDSDSDYATRTPRKSFGANIAPLGSGMAAGGFLPGDLAAAGTPSNLGKIGEAALADADPLGVNMNVNFDEIGGLDEHIHSLKEMTLLPLLYPEVFQRFNVTPPRGVLFHGPPGTGKTLMARALAASCRSNGKQISFFMRKGADCLSKWVGEAERQLRLLFEEAKASQPSIIFFDEIDGLAPVRSSKQDQIHASIVSTLLALMDGMDGRGQVVVIGATNRPDAVDPALRRPGRFDREFYFGLPTVEAREKILGIMTRKWAGWGGENGEDVKERVRGLATMTKGYGGADLRALCTEAALNAVQRRYPQIYKSMDRLLLKPETINIGLRDFMISIKKIVPSSSRSSSSAASPLPSQFVSLLGDILEQVKSTISRVMPMEKRLSALEEAEFEDVGGEEGGLEKEMLMQSMQTLRIYRPRVIVHGPVGMGQNYVGAAALHFLEGCHIQSLELGTLIGDSTRTVEAAIVQLFVEAKRHQPSVIYIPSLVGWCAAVAETSRSTVRAMLDTLAPTDPILLLAVVDGDFASLPRDVKAWFGPTKGNRIVLASPSPEKRAAFFEGLIKDACRPPNLYADGMERKKRVLEVLPVAPPLEPRQPSAAELAVQEANDQRTIALLKYRLGPILTELKRKFKRFCKRASDEYSLDLFDLPPIPNPGEGVLNVNTQPQPQLQSDAIMNGIIVVDEAGVAETVVNGQVNGETTEEGVQQQQEQLQQQLQQQQAVLMEQPKLYDMDLERMHDELYRGRYLTPQNFLNDVAKILRNAEARAHKDLDRLHKAQAMYTFAEVSILEFDPTLRMECERMAVRERKRLEENRKNRDKLKGKEDATQQQNGNGNGMLTRRSARANGLEPEHRITDPVKLERRLKRQRGETGGDAATDSHGSEEGETEGRESKRAKHAGDARREDDDDRDPLDCIGPSPAPSPQPHHQQHHHHHHHHHHQHVRFATTEIEASPAPQARPPSLGPLPPEQVPAPSSILVERKEVTVVNVIPRKQGGFDPFLLNPESPSEAVFPPPPATMVNGIPLQPIQDSDPANPFFTFAPPAQPVSLASIINVDAQSQHQPNVEMDTRRSGSPSRGVEQTQHEQPPPEAMVVERTPTPLPDFHVDEELLFELRRRLTEDTAPLTIEQLEQLRATCLGSVWRHRKEWNRYALFRELLDIVREFAEEVVTTDDDE